MNLAKVISTAYDSIQANRMRSLLTILGIVIGVASVVAMISIGEGVKNNITDQMSGIGSNLIFIMPGNLNYEVRNTKFLTMEDVNALSDQAQAPSIKSAVPVLEGEFEVRAGRKTKNLAVTGVTPAYHQARNYQMTEGDFFGNEHQVSRASVAVIGPSAAQKLFGRKEGVIGEMIQIQDQSFTVVGVFKAKGGGMGVDEDSAILVPIATAQSRLFTSSADAQKLSLILAQSLDQNTVDQAAEEIRSIVRSRHRIKSGDPDDFSVITQKAFTRTVSQIYNTMTIFLSGVAAISLLVGGIGIMNIMLVSVTERTREIGLRKALGARRVNILLQFLAESALLSLFGGLIGIVFGFIISLVVSQVAAAQGTTIPAALSPKAVVLATVFSAAVGIFFGIYPANRAAGMEPVEALRYE